MAKTLLINPRRRSRKARRNPSAAQLRARARFAAMARGRGKAKSNPRRRRRRNPIAVAGAPMINPRRRHARRRNPVLIYRRARRRNPISLGGSSLSVNNIMSIAKDAVIQGGGAIAMDLAYAQIARFLPASLQVTPGQVSVGSAVKLGLTAALGILLNKPTKGLARKAAIGAATVQARDIILGMLPPSVTGTVQGLSYASPAGIMNRSFRVNANGAGAMGAYMPGRPPLLNGRPGAMGQYLGPGAGVLLNGPRQSARAREGWPR